MSALNGKALGFGEHAGHRVLPHNHAGQPNGRPPNRRDKWCPQRWLCVTCADEDECPRGLWFTGPACARPGVVKGDPE